MNSPSLRLAVFAALASFTASAAEPSGILPSGRNGRPLNTDFETGTLQDWTADGDAFKQQPIEGDTVAKRRKDTRSAHAGKFWIGGYERVGDDPRGTLTSAPFKVTQPWAAFRIAGGGYENTRVELVRADTGDVVFKTTAFEPELFAKQNNASETMRPVVVDLREQQGKELFIRLVDQQGGHWGHLNFDDFKLYAERPTFTDEFKAVAQGLKALPGQENPLPFDEYKFAGLSGEDAAKAMMGPEGFSVKLFAAEPDVQQPIAMALDDRGRLWIAEGRTYPTRAPEGQGKDRILVFEDKDGDGRFDRRTVFIEGLNLVSGMEVGFGGVWVGAAPNLLFIPIQDGDEPKPAGPPKVMLDGWGYQDTHETLNTFIWGPDGWLYGCHGVFTQSNVGKPGAPDSERTRINAGIWRYHPIRHQFEVFGEGTSNPWGVDFNDYGQAFLTSCVIPHLFHVIQGARYNRQAGQHFNPYIFDDIKTCADHVHYASATPHAGNRRSGSAGGGHAHCGAMIYLGGSWPAEYRNEIFMNNIHGARINMDRLERSGSGYVGKHGPDFLMANDEWSQILNLRYGPDGSAYMIDWYDKQACHTPNAAAHDRSNGRIFKVVHTNDKTVTGVDLTKLSGVELAKLQLSPNDWYVRHSRRLLEERGPNPEVHRALREILDAKNIGTAPAGFTQEQWTVTRQLRALWALQVTGGLDEKTLIALLNDDSEWLRAWAVQFLCEGRNPSDAAIKRFAEMAAGDKSSTVRLYLASAAQRIAPEKRWELVAALASHAEDAADQNVPLMVWYAAEPLPTLETSRALQQAMNAKVPRMLEFTSRRSAAIGTPEAFAALISALGNTQDEAKQLAMLQGMNDALRSQKQVSLPAGWEALAAKLSTKPALRDATLAASVKFGSGSALAVMREQLADPKAPEESRKAALEALLAAKDTSLAPILQRLLNEPSLRGPALRALASYSDASTPKAILAAYQAFGGGDRRDALNTLVSRATYARELVAAVEANTVPAKDLTAELVRQIRQMKQDDINSTLDRLWGAVRENPAEKQKEIERFKKIYQLGYSTPGDARKGRAIFARTCQQCHTLFGEGGKIGPDITGANRKDINYLLENIVTPNAVIPNDYRAAIIETKDGRTVMGPIQKQDEQSVTVNSIAEQVTVQRADIKSLQLSEVSMMPEGLLNALSDQEVRDLLYYLSSPAQVPLPADATTTASAAK
ncbi:PVC-type heme-binding CxxCH protein [Verrucomicrobiota bacterium sgz303538]